ncbi:uncharacterized protein LOC113146602 [Cyclospora cayetanensis]|uniref:Uncharacterized protein LOC113146602 n=1 Tax=Cyclospora cayetanensis TaxID=88456 RepID=A0A6P6RR12_9EIME|nr:uncharacterized protein LOC113146602 [Cyclospora cayetanensis]
MLKYGFFVAMFAFFAAHLTPQACWGWCHLRGFTLGKGKKIYLLKADSVEACSNVCESVSSCTHWSFDGVKNFCTLRRDNPTSKILIRKQEGTISATKDCETAIECMSFNSTCAIIYALGRVGRKALALHSDLALCPFVDSVITGGNSCFSDGWTVSETENYPSSELHNKPSALLMPATTVHTPEECQSHCQKYSEGCVLWEWHILTKQCRSWKTGVTLQRRNGLPIGFSLYFSPLEGDEVSHLEGGQGISRALESMGTIVGPPVCSTITYAERRNERVQRSSGCSTTLVRQFPWLFLSTATLGTSSSAIEELTSNKDGNCYGKGSACEISKSKAMSLKYQAAHGSFLQLFQSAISKVSMTQGLYIGVDSKTPYLSGVTDRTQDVSECRTLCTNTKKCQVYTFYIDGRSEANCVLKNTVYINELFLHPVAITGHKSYTNSPALNGMKFGYEMKSSIMVTPGYTLSQAHTYASLYTSAGEVEKMAQQACKLLAGEGWAVLDYVGRTAHAVPSSEAVEVVMPNFNSIECSKII